MSSPSSGQRSCGTRSTEDDKRFAANQQRVRSQQRRSGSEQRGARRQTRQRSASTTRARLSANVHNNATPNVDLTMLFVSTPKQHDKPPKNINRNLTTLTTPSFPVRPSAKTNKEEEEKGKKKHSIYQHWERRIA
jgi:hypothetical protein